MSVYGYERETTPFISQFAQKATVYTEARSPSIWSLPSHVSLFTGLHPLEHQVNNLSDTLKPGYTIWEKLASDGYQTGAFSSNEFVTGDAPFSLSFAFEDTVGSLFLPFPDAANPDPPILVDNIYWEYLRKCFESGQPIRSILNGLANKFDIGIDENGKEYCTSFLDWVDDGSPWAACINFMDTHTPYEPRAKYDKWASRSDWKKQSSPEHSTGGFISGEVDWSQQDSAMNLYDGCIYQADSYLKYLIDGLEERGQLDNTLVIICSDHGEAFGENSRVRPNYRLVNHGFGIHESLVHVPLIVKAPNQTEGKQISDLSTLTGFSRAVKAARRDKDIEGAFIADTPIVLSSVGRPEEAPDSKADLDMRYYDNAHAVIDSDRQKHIKWGEDEAVVKLPEKSEPIRIDDRVGTIFFEAINEFDPEEVNTEFEGVEALTNETTNRLEDLGYL
jgi:arylsulfatase